MLEFFEFFLAGGIAPECLTGLQQDVEVVFLYKKWASSGKGGSITKLQINNDR